MWDSSYAAMRVFSSWFYSVNLVWWSVCSVQMINWSFTLDPLHLSSGPAKLSFKECRESYLFDIPLSSDLGKIKAKTLSDFCIQSFPKSKKRPQAWSWSSPPRSDGAYSRPNTAPQQTQSVFYTSLKMFALTLVWEFNNYSAPKPGL